MTPCFHHGSLHCASQIKRAAPSASASVHYNNCLLLSSAMFTASRKRLLCQEYGIARLLRLSTSDLRLKIPTENLPSTQRLVTLCQDIYIARAQGELVLEEELYAALISVYRSPAV
eukprot:scaffold29253_cov20-Tisochrysis_lutea.AAC.4